MAKITLSDLAPSEAVHFSFAEGDFTLGGKSDAKSYESDDRALLSNAEAHPWLQVEYDEGDAAPVYPDTTLPPTEDNQSAQGPVAHIPFDVAAIKEFEDSKHPGEVPTLAIDAGLDQSEKIVEGDAAKTLAADPTHVAAKSAAAFNDTTTTEDKS